MWFKRAQLAMFVMVAILLVVILVGGFLVVRFASDGDTNAPSDSSKYENIRYCFEDVIEEGVYYNFLQGGYYIPPRGSLSYDYIEIPVYFKANRSYLPSINTLESELETFVRDNGNVCFNGSASIDDLTIKIIPGSILYELKAPIIISEGNARYTVEKFEGEVDYDLFGSQALVEEYLTEQKTAPDYFYLSALNSIVTSNKYFYEVLEVDDDTKIISIILDNLNEKGPVVYNFALEYGK